MEEIKGKVVGRLRKEEKQLSPEEIERRNLREDIDKGERNLIILAEDLVKLVKIGGEGLIDASDIQDLMVNAQRLNVKNKRAVELGLEPRVPKLSDEEVESLNQAVEEGEKAGFCAGYQGYSWRYVSPYDAGKVNRGLEIAGKTIGAFFPEGIFWWRGDERSYYIRDTAGKLIRPKLPIPVGNLISNLQQMVVEKCPSGEKGENKN